VDMKKINGYPHNGYPTDMDTGTGTTRKCLISNQF